MSALILGHSYTRRLRGEALGHPYYRKQEDVSDEDTAKTLAAKLIINKKIEKIYTNSNFNTFRDFPIRLRTTCDIVLMDFGSNDLAELKTFSKSFCEKLVTFFITWAHASRAKKVLMCSILPRTGGIKSNTDIFESNRMYYNRVLRKRCKKSHMLTFVKIRGYERYPDRSLRPVSSWSTDGIHPTDMSRYLRLVAFQLLRASHELHKL